MYQIVLQEVARSYDDVITNTIRTDIPTEREALQFAKLHAQIILQYDSRYTGIEVSEGIVDLYEGDRITAQYWIDELMKN